MSDAGETLYDVVRYPSKAYAYAHPDRMAVVGRLFGMTPAEVETARVLEIGCGEGGNLIPMASHIPKGEFVGVDLAPTAVDAARSEIASFGLTNVEVFQADVTALPDDLGTFDYILSHGVYSWIPPSAQAGLLRACKALMRPQGVAYISYNTYPGWHLHNVARDLMRLHAEQFDEPEEQIAQSMAFLRFLAKGLGEQKAAYAHVVRGEDELMRKHSGAYMFHDFLAPTNKPLLFRDFVRIIEGHGMSYLGDALFGEMMANNLPQQIRETLEGVSADLVSLEQYMDFVRGTGFRRSLAIHDDVEITRHIDGTAALDMYVVMKGAPKVTEVDLTTKDPVDFETDTGLTVVVGSRLGKAALVRLGTLYPGEIRLRELADLAQEWIEPDESPTAEELRELGGMMVYAFGAGLVDLVPRARGHVTSLSRRPMSDRYARFMAGADRDRIINRRHEMVEVSRFDLELLRLADGTRDHDALVQCCIDAVQEGRLSVKLEGEETDDRDVIVEAMEAAVQPQLLKLAATALLAG